MGVLASPTAVIVLQRVRVSHRHGRRRHIRRRLHLILKEEERSDAALSPLRPRPRERRALCRVSRQKLK